MVKTFIAGLAIGVAGVTAAVYLWPAVDQHREVSVITVAPNGANLETFQVNIPMDRILVGTESDAAALPIGLEWPDDAVFDGSRTELYKLRNARNAVVGVASRLSAADRDVGDIIEWVLHLPARGSIYMSIDPQAAGNQRTGRLRAGTREFAGLSGTVSERWVADAADDGAVAGRIELKASYTARAAVDGAETAE